MSHTAVTRQTTIPPAISVGNFRRLHMCVSAHLDSDTQRMLNESCGILTGPGLPLVRPQ
jgi:hypothetical protein